MIGRVFFTAVALCWLCLPAIAADDEAIIWATDGLYPPFSDADANGEPAGLDRDIAAAVCMAMERPCRFVVMPWSELYPGLTDGRFNVIFSGLSPWTIEAAGAEPSAAYFSTAGRFVALLDRREPIDTVTGTSLIGVLSGTPHAAYLELVVADPARLNRFPDEEEMYLALLAGSIDAVFGDGMLLYHDLLRPSVGLSLAFVEPALDDTEYFEAGLVFALRAGDPLTADINRALERLKQKGNLDTIVEGYLPGFTTP